MKNKILFLSLTSLALFAVKASATTTPQQDDTTIEMPAYVVESPRYLPAEKNIESALSELRSQAQAPVAVFAELPSLKSNAALHTSHEVKTAQQLKTANKVAKL